MRSRFLQRYGLRLLPAILAAFVVLPAGLLVAGNVEDDAGLLDAMAAYEAGNNVNPIFNEGSRRLRE